MRHARLIAALLVALASTSAYAGSGNGNGNANGYDNGTAAGHDKGDRDEDAPTAAAASAVQAGTVVLSPEAAAAASDQNVALDAVQAGEALPLSDIVRRVRSMFSARLLDARLLERRSGLIYRLTILTDAGVSKRVDLDAKAGTLVRSR